MRIKLSSGCEFDLLTARRFSKRRAGECKAIKRQYNKRFRKATKATDFDAGGAPVNVFPPEPNPALDHCIRNEDGSIKFYQTD